MDFVMKPCWILLCPLRSRLSTVWIIIHLRQRKSPVQRMVLYAT